jgi:secreted trypsin-like serine protease
MSEGKCIGCGGTTQEFDAQLAFARLARRHQQLADVVQKLMLPPATRSLAGAAAAAPPDPAHLARVLARIVGGHPTGGFPDCCLVGHKNPNGTIGWFCSGVLIHPQIVLTAGHCIEADNRANVVALGTSDQNQLSNAELINIRRITVHPRYQQTKQLSDMTVMVLRSAARTAPTTIATPPELNATAKVTLVGFGNDDVNSTKGFGIKREVDVNMISIRRNAADNLDTEEHQFGYESDFEFVAGGEGFDTCNGDSGGPVYIATNGGNKVCGLTSRATEQATHACGDGGIYTRIDVHMDFVRRTAADAGINLP